MKILRTLIMTPLLLAAIAAGYLACIVGLAVLGHVAGFVGLAVGLGAAFIALWLPSARTGLPDDGSDRSE